MIECVDRNIWYRKKSKRKKRKSRVFLFFISLIFIFAVFLYYRFIVAKNVTSYCNDLTSSYALEYENLTVNSLFNDVKYSDLVTIEKNASGEVSLISVNTIAANKIATETAKNVKLLLSSKISNGIPIPFMAFSGISALSGYGSPIYFRSLSIVEVKSDFTENFKSVGINQTLHSVYVVIQVKTKIKMFFYEMENASEHNIMLSNAVIVGKIPDIYLNKNS